MKTKLLFTTFLILTIFGYTQTTSIPDDNFENYLETHDANGNTVSIGDPTSMGNGIANDDLVLTNAIDTVTTLNISFLSIADLTGIENFTALTTLRLTSNDLTSVNLAANTALEVLEISNNNLVSLDLTQNTALATLNISNNQFTSINLMQNAALVDFTYFSFNASVTDLNLSGNTALQTLSLGKLDISTLNLTANTALRDFSLFDCDNIDGSGITLNSNITDISFSGNDGLTALDLTAYAMLTSASINQNSTLSSIDITDITSLTALSISSNPMLSIINVTTNTGLENLFISSQSLITDINLTQNMALKSFSAQNVPLNSLDATENLALESLSVSGTFSTIDLSDNTMLKSLRIDNNPNFNDLDIMINTNLEELRLSDLPSLSSINLMANDQLIFLSVRNSVFSELDISENTLLEELSLSENQNLIEINVSLNTELMEIDFEENPFTGLDFSSNLNLRSVSIASHPNLLSINLANGNNANIENFTAFDNPQLTCVQVDEEVDGENGIDAANNNEDWSINGDGDDRNTPSLSSRMAVYSLDCSNVSSPFTNVPDDVFEDYLETHTADGMPVALGDPNSLGNGVMDDLVPTAKIEIVQFLEISTDIEDPMVPAIANLTGIENFAALEELFIATLATTANFNQNANLIDLYIEAPNLTDINLTGLSSMVTLSIDNLDETLASLNTSDLSNLESFELFGGDLSTVNLTSNTLLETISIRDTPLQTLDLTQNTLLREVDLKNTLITEIPPTLTTAITELRLRDNFGLMAVNFSPFTSLTSLVFSGSPQITSINLDLNIALRFIDISDSFFTEADLSNNTLLEIVEFYDNGNLVSIDLKNGANDPLLDEFRAEGNINLQCIQVDNVTYSTNNIRWTKENGVYSTDCASVLSLDNFEITEFSIYPNPTTNHLNINGLKQTETVEVYSITGKKLFKKSLNQNDNSIDITQLSSGIYFLKLKDQSLKFIKI